MCKRLSIFTMSQSKENELNIRWWKLEFDREVLFVDAGDMATAKMNTETSLFSASAGDSEFKAISPKQYMRMLVS